MSFFSLPFPKYPGHQLGVHRAESENHHQEEVNIGVLTFQTGVCGKSVDSGFTLEEKRILLNFQHIALGGSDQGT